MTFKTYLTPNFTVYMCSRYEKLQNGVKHFDNDGLNSLKYKVIEIKKTPLYIRIQVDINQDQKVSCFFFSSQSQTHVQLFPSFRPADDYSPFPIGWDRDNKQKLIEIVF